MEHTNTLPLWNTQTLCLYGTHKHFASMEHTNTLPLWNTQTLCLYGTHKHFASMEHTNTLPLWNTQTLCPCGTHTHTHAHTQMCRFTVPNGNPSSQLEVNLFNGHDDTSNLTNRVGMVLLNVGQVCPPSPPPPTHTHTIHLVCTTFTLTHTHTHTHTLRTYVTANH
jgi:hypothetical protein